MNSIYKWWRPAPESWTLTVTDVVDKSTRSRMMSGIRGKNTKPELRLRSVLHLAGFRFRLHYRHLPGRPDLVLPKFRAAVFVHGCFWHQHQGCPAATMPASNVAFWQGKLGSNVARDQRTASAVRAAGWRVATIWECALRQLDDGHLAAVVGAWIRGPEASFELPVCSLATMAKPNQTLDLPLLDCGVPQKQSQKGSQI